MERTTRESDRQGPGLLPGGFSANNSQQQTDKQSSKSSQQGNSPRRLGFWLYFGVMSWRDMRQMQEMQGGGLFGIGRSRAKLYREERPTTTFEDVAGVDEAKTEVREVREPLPWAAGIGGAGRGVL